MEVISPLRNILYFEDNSFYEIIIESLKIEKNSLYGVISFYEKDFSVSNHPVIKRKYESESFFCCLKHDEILNSRGEFTDYKRLLKERIELSAGINFSEKQLDELFSPLENQLKLVNRNYYK